MIFNTNTTKPCLINDDTANANLHKSQYGITNCMISGKVKCFADDRKSFMITFLKGGISHLTPKSEILDLCFEITNIGYLRSVVSGSKNQGDTD